MPLVVAADPDLGKLVQLDLVVVGRGKGKAAWIEIDGERIVVREFRAPEPQRQHRRVAEHPGVVQRQDLRPPPQVVVVRIGEAGRLALVGGAEEVGLGLIRAVVQVEPAQRHVVGELVLELDRVQLREIALDARCPGVVRAAVVPVGVGQGHELEHGHGDRAHHLRRNLIAGKRQPGDRVVDRHRLAGRIGHAREVAATHGRGRKQRADVARLHVVVALGREPEERAVSDDRPANRPAAQIVGAIGFRPAGPLAEVVVPLSPDWPGLEEGRPAILVRPGLQRRVEHPAAGAAHFRIVGVHLHLHVLERFDRRVRARAVAHVGDRHAVERVVVAAAGAAPERDERHVRLILLPVVLPVSGWHNGRHGVADHERRAPLRGQRLQCLGVQHGAGRRVRRLDERRLTGDGDRLGQGADFERDVERDELLRADRNALLCVGLVALERDLQPIRPRRQVREAVFTGPVVVVDRDSEVPWLVSVTSAPGMTPPESLTTPRIPP